MSLPAVFKNENDFFEAALKFLKQNQIFFNYPNTDVLTENVLEGMVIDNLVNADVFGKDFNIADFAQLKDTFEEIDKLKYHHQVSELQRFDAEYFRSLPLGAKKQQEINYLSQVVHENCERLRCGTVVDFGCGLGYLDQLLFKKHNYQVLGLEYNRVCLNGALRRQANYHRESIDNVKYVSHHIGDGSDVVILKLLEENFPESGDFCIVGLHACADLTVDAINTFLKTARSKGLVLISCCYHKMSLKKSETCQNVDGNGKCENGLEGVEYVEKSKEDKETFSSDSANLTHFTVKYKEKNETVPPDLGVEYSEDSKEDNETFPSDSNTVEITEKANEEDSDDIAQCQEKRNIDSKSAEKYQLFNKFPLSESLKRVYEKYEASKFLRIPFLRLAAQPPSVTENLELLSFRLLSRAILQLYCSKHSQRLVLKRRRAVKLASQMNDFQAYIMDATKNGYSLKCDSKFCSSLQDDEVPDRYKEQCKCLDGFHTEELLTLWQHYADDLTFKKAAILILLQRHLQPVFENLVLLDRIVYLKEKGIRHCSFVKIVDEKISPRCLALVALK